MQREELQGATLAIGIGRTHVEKAFGIIVGIHVESHLSVVLLGIGGMDGDGLNGQRSFNLQILTVRQVAHPHKAVASTFKGPQGGRVGHVGISPSSVDVVVGKSDAIHQAVTCPTRVLHGIEIATLDGRRGGRSTGIGRFAITVDGVCHIGGEAFKSIDAGGLEGIHRVVQFCHLRINFLLCRLFADALRESLCRCHRIHQVGDGLRRIAQGDIGLRAMGQFLRTLQSAVELGEEHLDQRSVNLGKREHHVGTVQSACSPNPVVGKPSGTNLISVVGGAVDAIHRHLAIESRLRRLLVARVVDGQHGGRIR